MSLLEVKQVSYCYPGGEKNVLKGVSIRFEPEKMYGIIGKSGSGKTTLLSLMAGLETCREGEILFHGEDLKQMDLDEYRATKIGVVFQGYNLLTTATALENVILAMEISGVKGKKESRAYELLESVGISKEMAKRNVLRLSGGEQQRVGIACAVSYDPEIIFADEPTGNLDAENEKMIMELFTDLARKQKKCVVIVTHSKRVEKYVDELYGMQNGRTNFLL